MGRSPCCSKVGLNRGAWTASEDKLLTTYIKANGEGKWTDLPKKAGLKRCGKSCRLRWFNYLTPDIKRGNISLEEEDLIIRLHRLLGNRWSLIAGRLPGRTDNEIKNYWNTTLSKKVRAQLPSSSEPPKENPKSKSTAKKSAIWSTVSPSAAIKNKAQGQRCNEVSAPAVTLPCDTHCISPTPQSLPTLQAHQKIKSQPTNNPLQNSDYLLDLDFFRFCSDEFQARDDGERNDNITCKNDFSFNLDDHSEPVHEAMKNDYWKFDDFFEDNNFFNLISSPPLHDYEDFWGGEI